MREAKYNGPQQEEGTWWRTRDFEENVGGKQVRGRAESKFSNQDVQCCCLPLQLATNALSGRVLGLSPAPLLSPHVAVVRKESSILIKAGSSSNTVAHSSNPCLWTCFAYNLPQTARHALMPSAPNGTYRPQST